MLSPWTEGTEGGYQKGNSPELLRSCTLSCSPMTMTTMAAKQERCTMKSAPTESRVCSLKRRMTAAAWALLSRRMSLRKRLPRCGGVRKSEGE